VLYYENKLRKQGYDRIIGVDEAGRGCLAGPVVAAAVALKTFSFTNRIDDSKKLTALQRERAYPEILEKSISSVGIVDEKTIDRVNILVATRMAMAQALDALFEKLGAGQLRPHVLIDGVMRLALAVPSTEIIDGDAKSRSIAAASIVAKVTRDRLMQKLHAEYPQYGFSRHKGYGTAEHYAQIRKFGTCAIHRMTFQTCHESD